MAPASAVVSKLPELNLSGALLAAVVPAFRCSTAVGSPVPMPTFAVE